MVNVCINIPYMDFTGLKPQTCFFSNSDLPPFDGICDDYLESIWCIWSPFLLSKVIFPEIWRRHTKMAIFKTEVICFHTIILGINIRLRRCFQVSRWKRFLPLRGWQFNKKTHPKQHGDIPFKWGCGRIFWGPWRFQTIILKFQRHNDLFLLS